jgi:hypothetical protein
MTPTDELHAEYWRAIALAVLAYAPNPLRRLVDELGQVPTEESVRKLRQWNDGVVNHLQVQSANEICRDSIWRN